MSPSQRFLVVVEQKFDLGGTQRLFELFAVPREQREEAWLSAFHAAAWNASMLVPTPQVMTGPDGFPYLRLILPAAGEPFQANCLSNVCAYCAERGLGVAFFARVADPPMAVQCTISAGVIESLRQFGSWTGDPLDCDDAPPLRNGHDKAAAEGERASVVTHKIAAHRQVLVGAPAADYLPPHTARLLRRHLVQGWKIVEPRVALLVDPQLRPTRHLVIGKKRSEFPDEATARRQTGMLLWYLPPRRSLILLPEDWALDRLTPLTDLCK